ncbi:hypothetical protein GCM10009601_16380 [Streptomyces thermospinosisporus]|uniref:Secreted protein n=1 Tax=Streptomyces thermospinosisporus TaxID=161482 RepID=A0ABN1YR88_9ACTN
MVSSQMLWQDMHALTQSCISLLIGVAAADWVMASSQGTRGGRGSAPAPPSYARCSKVTTRRTNPGVLSAAAGVLPLTS